MTSEDNWRIDHTGIGVSDIAKAAKFYDAALGALGLEPIARITKTFAAARSGSDPELGGVCYGASYPIFWIDVFHPHGTKQHVAFRARSRGEVEDFHRAAISSGGQDNGGPGLRSGNFPPGYFAAFVLDPDGNNIEAVFRES
jgi:catechol 2,3-dioxygenase-like lactoylglutathione lyase family enzyme